jgi:2'-5' RNA ligase
MRLFFALWPDAGTRDRIAKAAATLDLAPGARRVPLENYHLTLAFVGEAAESQLEPLLEIGRSQRGSACTLRFDAYEYWPEPQVAVAVAPETPAATGELWHQLHEALAGRNATVKSEGPKAPLRAHVTLARKVTQAPVLQAMSPFCWSARSFSLVRSDTSGPQSVYTVVDTWPLLDETPKAEKSP